MISANLTERIKEKAYDLGIDMIGVVPAKAIDQYAGIEEIWENYKFKKTTDYLKDAKSVIVLGNGIWDDSLDIAVRKNNEWVYPGEMLLSVHQRDLALYLQREGMQVYAGYPQISHKYLAQLGGLGSIGKHTMVITRKFGAQVRFRCIITDVELQYDEPPTVDLCLKCDICIKKCPVGAITDYKVAPATCIIGRNLKDKYVDPEILAKYESKITENSHIMCRVCQTVCPIGRDS